MAIAITEDHRALAAVATDFCARRDALGLARATRDAATDGTPLWDDMAALGWLGLHLPEQYGGSGYGLAELAVVLEATGAALLPGPLLPTVLASYVIDRAGDDALRAALLPGFADGSRLGGTGRVGGGVLGASHAHTLVLVDGADVLVMAADAPGVTITERGNLDRTRRTAQVTLEPAARQRATRLTGAAVIVERAGVALGAAEAAGGSRACVELATAYAKQRVQFGRVIGSFQAVKHMLADALASAELATAVAWDAARAIDAATAVADDEQAAFACAVAGSVALEAYETCAKTSIQVHGGIGCTYEHDAHLWFRRATALTATFGTIDAHHATAADLAASGVVRGAEVDLGAEGDAFRAQVRAFVERYASLDAADRPDALANSGYLFPHWPEPWGRGAGPVEQLVVEQELRGRVRQPNMGLASWNLPTIIAYGTPEQQEKWVGNTLRGELMWCQLFSEPDAGSDLASLTTRAEKVPGGWKLNGQKVWTSIAHLANAGLCVARTNPHAPKHQGISCFVVDMKAPGVDVRPLRELTGHPTFNEVFFDDVFLPDDALIGEVDHGWAAARTTLANERVSLSGAGTALFATSARGLLDLASRYPNGAGFRQEIGALIAHDQAMALLGLRRVGKALEGTEPGAEGNVGKLLGSEHDKRVTDLAMRIAGPDAVFDDDDMAVWSTSYLFSRALSIAGGTSQVLRNVIAERLLGLPREPMLG
jgi:alkylation response protein AidB-like acyl-CoA dehydrogenase